MVYITKLQSSNEVIISAYRSTSKHRQNIERIFWKCTAVWSLMIENLWGKQQIKLQSQSRI
jgi:hypothetical protein